MQHPCCHPGEAVQGLRMIQVAMQGLYSTCAKLRHAVGARGQGQQPDSRRQALCHAQSDIATPNDKHAFTAKAGRQCAQRGLV